MTQERDYRLSELELSGINELRGQAQEVMQHYNKFLVGKIVKLFKVDGPSGKVPFPFYILVYESEPINYPGITYVTVGGSSTNYPYPNNWRGKKKARLGEYVTYSRSFDPQILNLLTSFLLYTYRTNSFLDVNHTIEDSGGASLIEKSRFIAGVFAYPFIEVPAKDFSHIFFKDGTNSHILWFIPVSAEERRFFKQTNPVTFYNLIMDKNSDLADWQRPSFL